MREPKKQVGQHITCDRLDATYLQSSFSADDLMVTGCKNGDISKTDTTPCQRVLRLALYETARKPLELLARLNKQASIGNLDWHLLASVSCPDVQTRVLRDAGLTELVKAAGLGVRYVLVICRGWSRS